MSALPLDLLLPSQEDPKCAKKAEKAIFDQSIDQLSTLICLERIFKPMDAVIEQNEEEFLLELFYRAFIKKKRVNY